jgi:cell shape-determining protein MreC
MAKFNLSPSRALTLAIGLTGFVSLLPARWLGWTGILAEIVALPVQPLADAGVRLARWLRPLEGEAGESQGLRDLRAELEATRGLLHAERLKVEGLLEEIEAMREARAFRPGVEMTPLYARVVGLPPDRGQGPVRLGAGSRHGVEAGAIAVYRGGHLLGRVAPDVSRLSSRLVPLTDPATGLVEAIVIPAADPLRGLENTPRLQLAPDGHGALTGDLDRNVSVQRDDLVRLADPLWPDSAQGLIIGTVVSVVPKDLQPLLSAITVRPRFQAQRVGAVTLIIERAGAREGGP